MASIYLSNLMRTVGGGYGSTQYEPASVASALLASGAQGLRAKEVDERIQLEKDFQAWQKERFGKEMEFKESEAERSGGQFEKTFGLQEKSFGLQEKQLAANIEANRIRNMLSLGTPSSISTASKGLGVEPVSTEDMYTTKTIPWELERKGQTKNIQVIKPEYAQAYGVSRYTPQTQSYNVNTPAPSRGVETPYQKYLKGKISVFDLYGLK